MKEDTTALMEQFSDGHLITFVTDVCKAIQQLLKNLVEYDSSLILTSLELCPGVSIMALNKKH